MKKPFVLVAVPFKGKPKFVLDLLYSLNITYASGFSYSLMLWDDGSSDDELNYLYSSIVKTYGNDKFLIIKHDNVGYTKSVYNITEFAKSQLQYDYLLLLNSDTKFKPNTIFSLVSRIKINANIAAVGGKVLKMGTNLIQHTGTIIKDGEVYDPYCGLESKDPITMNVERRLWVNGACTLYNLHILRKENLNFNLDFSPAYFEEADLQSELNIRGYSILYEPRSEIEHFVNGTMGDFKQEYEKVFWANWERYLQKWKPYFKTGRFLF